MRTAASLQPYYRSAKRGEQQTGKFRSRIAGFEDRRSVER
jgi:hypothetical protein